MTASEEGGETLVAELEFEVFRLEVNQQLSIDKEGPYRATRTYAHEARARDNVLRKKVSVELIEFEYYTVALPVEMEKCNLKVLRINF